MPWRRAILAVCVPEPVHDLVQVAIGMGGSRSLRPLERWLGEPVDGLQRQALAYVLGVAISDPDHLPRDVGGYVNAAAAGVRFLVGAVRGAHSPESANTVLQSSLMLTTVQPSCSARSSDCSAPAVYSNSRSGSSCSSRRRSPLGPV